MTKAEQQLLISYKAIAVDMPESMQAMQQHAIEFHKWYVLHRNEYPSESLEELYHIFNTQ